MYSEKLITFPTGFQYTSSNRFLPKSMRIVAMHPNSPDDYSTPKDPLRLCCQISK